MEILYYYYYVIIAMTILIILKTVLDKLSDLKCTDLCITRRSMDYFNA